MRSALLALLLAAAWPALPAAAQEDADPNTDLVRGILADGPSLAESEAATRCLELGPPVAADADEEGADVLCEVQESGELERAGDRRYVWTRYAWTTVLPPADPRNPDLRDTVREEEAVLFSAPLDGTRLTAEWHLRYEPEMTASVHLEMGPVGDDGALLGVRSCVNGTGGCGQQFLLRRSDGWRPVRDTWVHQLPGKMEGAFWKGSYINPLTLQGQAALYSPDDANCCPSRLLYFRVRLEDDALVLRDHRVVVSPYD